MNAAIKFFTEEWYFALPLVLMSLCSACLVIWRILLNRSAKTDMDEFLPVFQDTLRKKGIKGAIALCKEEPGLIPSRLYVAGLEASDQGAAAMKRSMATETELEILPRLNALLPMILAVAKIATMVGLLFTVISMINTFNAIGDSSKEGKAKDVGGHSAKIGLALFATAIGLFTAIPLVFGHVLFKAWIAKFENKMKVASHKLLTLVATFKKDPRLLEPPKKEKDKDAGGKDRERDRGRDRDRDRDDDDGRAEARPVREGRRG